MELRHLRYFVAVAQELNFARAAARIGIEQSPLSRAIRELEADLEVSLLIRTSRRMRLTAAGDQLLMDARRVLRAVRQVKTGARSAVSGRGQPLRLGISPVLAGPYLSKIWSQMRQDDEGLELIVHDLGADQHIAELEAGVIDISLAPRQAVGPGVGCMILGSTPIVALLPVTHRHAHRGQICWDDLESEEIISGHPDLLATLGEQAKRLSLVEAPNFSLLVEQVVAGLTIGLVFACQLHAAPRAQLAILPLAKSAASAYATWYGSEPTPAAQRFVDHARRVLSRTNAGVRALEVIV